MTPISTTSPPNAPAGPCADENGRTWTLPPEVIPNLDDLVIEDGKPVDGIITEKQMRLLTEPLYASWPGPGAGRPFVVLSDVGLFFSSTNPPLVPDVMLSLDVTQGADFSQRANLSYFSWLRGKGPDVAIEVVSNREGGEDDRKLRDYARIHVPYYVIFDPECWLGPEVVRVYQLQGLTYQALAADAAGTYWLPGVGLGLRLWPGEYERLPLTWLRWCERDGRLIPTGGEAAEQLRQRAEQEQQARLRAEQELDQLRQRLRSLGLPSE